MLKELRLQELNTGPRYSEHGLLVSIMHSSRKVLQKLMMSLLCRPGSALFQMAFAICASISFGKYSRTMWEGSFTHRVAYFVPFL